VRRSSSPGTGASSALRSSAVSSPSGSRRVCHASRENTPSIYPGWRESKEGRALRLPLPFSVTGTGDSWRYYRSSLFLNHGNTIVAPLFFFVVLRRSRTQAILRTNTFNVGIEWPSKVALRCRILTRYSYIPCGGFHEPTGQSLCYSAFRSMLYDQQESILGFCSSKNMTLPYDASLPLRNPTCARAHPVVRVTDEFCVRRNRRNPPPIHLLDEIEIIKAPAEQPLCILAMLVRDLE
jgi:hypothetical protein